MKACSVRTVPNLSRNGVITLLAVLAASAGIGSASGQLVVTNNLPIQPIQLTLSACQITEQVTTNWIAISGALLIEPDTNGNMVSYAIERETILTNVILKATYSGKEYSYILESHQRANSGTTKRMVPIQAERPPSPLPLPVPVIGTNAVYFRTQDKP